MNSLCVCCSCCFILVGCESIKAIDREKDREREREIKKGAIQTNNKQTTKKK